jgi:hypothetical protein
VDQSCTYRVGTIAGLLAVLAGMACSPTPLLRPPGGHASGHATTAPATPSPPSRTGSPFCSLGPGDNVRPGDGGAACGVTLGLLLAALDCTGLAVLPSNFLAEADQISGGASRPTPVRFSDGACAISTSIPRGAARIRPQPVMPADLVAIADFTSDLLPPTVINLNVRCTIDSCVGATVELDESAMVESVASRSRTLSVTQDNLARTGVVNRLVVSTSGNEIEYWLNGHGYGPFQTGVLKPGYVTFNVSNRDGSLLAQAGLVRLQVFARL